MLNFSVPYFDNNATTQVSQRVLDVLNEYNSKYFANPSSSHKLGMICNALYEKHRKSIADIFNVSENEVIFTSGSTESINTAIKGLYFQYASQKNHIISCKTEHSAVLNTLYYLEKYHKAKITLLDVDDNGSIDLKLLEQSINEKTLLVCLMAANNETGVIHPLNDIYKITQKKNVLFFSDTTQIFGKTDITQIPADIFCGSGHKIYACKGIGFLVIKNLGRKVFLHSLIHGGLQQEYRSGTLPLPLIAVLSTAIEDIFSNTIDVSKIKELRDYFEQRLKTLEDFKIHGEKVNRLVNTCNAEFSEKYYEALIKLMKKFCYSHGSACSDGSGKPSHVLTAMGLSEEQIKRSFRFSFSKYNKKEEVDKFFEELLRILSNGVE
jgi:cysteine desulfurase